MYDFGICSAVMDCEVCGENSFIFTKYVDPPIHFITREEELEWTYFEGHKYTVKKSFKSLALLKRVCTP